jgi:hypothetical protein
VLSHAGLSVTGSGVNLICDPWLVGSCYWRSWWNYYEYDWLPLRRAFKYRVLETYLLRWREIILYIQLLWDLARTKRLDTAKYLAKAEATP